MSLFDKKNRKRVTVYLDPEHLEAVERIQVGVGNGATQAEVLRFALGRGLPTIERSIEREREEAAQAELAAAQEFAEHVEAGTGNTPPGWARAQAEEEFEERTGARLVDVPQEDQVLELYRVNKRAWELVEADEADEAEASSGR